MTIPWKAIQSRTEMIYVKPKCKCIQICKLYSNCLLIRCKLNQKWKARRREHIVPLEAKLVVLFIHKSWSSLVKEVTTKTFDVNMPNLTIGTYYLDDHLLHNSVHTKEEECTNQKDQQISSSTRFFSDEPDPRLQLWSFSVDWLPPPTNERIQVRDKILSSHFSLKIFHLPGRVL